jgi:hypothetical protein
MTPKQGTSPHRRFPYCTTVPTASATRSGTSGACRVLEPSDSPTVLSRLRSCSPPVDRTTRSRSGSPPGIGTSPPIRPTKTALPMPTDFAPSPTSSVNAWSRPRQCVMTPGPASGLRGRERRWRCQVPCPATALSCIPGRASTIKYNQLAARKAEHWCRTVFLWKLLS